MARKLGVLLHGLWVSGEVYEPLRNSGQFVAAAAQLRSKPMGSTKSKAEFGDCVYRLAQLLILAIEAEVD